MSNNSDSLSIPVQLALLAGVILNLAIGIVHVVGALVGEGFNVWQILPYLDAILLIILSWQLLQLVDYHRLNFSFQLGGMFAVGTFILDFFLYIIPKPGTITDTIAQLQHKLIIHYGVIFLTPMLVAILQTIWIRIKE